MQFYELVNIPGSSCQLWWQRSQERLWLSDQWCQWSNIFKNESIHVTYTHSIKRLASCWMTVKKHERSILLWNLPHCQSWCTRSRTQTLRTTFPCTLRRLGCCQSLAEHAPLGIQQCMVMNEFTTWIVLNCWTAKLLDCQWIQSEAQNKIVILLVLLLNPALWLPF